MAEGKMKKLITLLLLGIVIAFGDQFAVTDNDIKVFLKDNGTWHSVVLSDSTTKREVSPFATTDDSQIVFLKDGGKWEYLQKQLTIEIEKSIIATSSDWDAFISKSRQLGRAGLLIKESKKWDCYQGEIKIPEWEFYEIAGFHEYAEKAKSYKSRRDLYAYGARACFLVSLGMLLVDYLGALSKLETRGPGTLTWVALGFASVGFTFKIISGPPKSTTVDFAVTVGDDYNKQLRKFLEE